MPFSATSPSRSFPKLRFAFGTGAGFLVGLLFSHMPRVNEVFRVFIMAVNSVPRAALVPLVLVLAGPGRIAAVIMAVLVVFFLTFFNAYEGGVSVPKSIMQNAQVMGAPPAKIMLHVRLRYVLLWMFAALPHIVASSLLISITTELISGSSGTGGLLLRSTVNLDSTGTMAIILYLTVTSVLFITVAELGKRRLLHWAPSQAG